MPKGVDGGKSKNGIAARRRTGGAAKPADAGSIVGGSKQKKISDNKRPVWKSGTVPITISNRYQLSLASSEKYQDPKAVHFRSSDSGESGKPNWNGHFTASKNAGAHQSSITHSGHSEVRNPLVPGSRRSLDRRVIKESLPNPDDLADGRKPEYPSSIAVEDGTQLTTTNRPDVAQSLAIPEADTEARNSNAFLSAQTPDIEGLPESQVEASLVSESHPCVEQRVEIALISDDKLSQTDESCSTCDTWLSECMCIRGAASTLPTAFKESDYWLTYGVDEELCLNDGLNNGGLFSRPAARASDMNFSLPDARFPVVRTAPAHELDELARLGDVFDWDLGDVDSDGDSMLVSQTSIFGETYGLTTPIANSDDIGFGVLDSRKTSRRSSLESGTGLLPAPGSDALHVPQTEAEIHVGTVPTAPIDVKKRIEDWARVCKAGSEEAITKEDLDRLISDIGLALQQIEQCDRTDGFNFSALLDVLLSPTVRNAIVDRIATESVRMPLQRTSSMTSLASPRPASQASTRPRSASSSVLPRSAAPAVDGHRRPVDRVVHEYFRLIGLLMAEDPSLDLRQDGLVAADRAQHFLKAWLSDRVKIEWRGKDGFMFSIADNAKVDNSMRSDLLAVPDLPESVANEYARTLAAFVERQEPEIGEDLRSFISLTMGSLDAPREAPSHTVQPHDGVSLDEWLNRRHMHTALARHFFDAKTEMSADPTARGVQRAPEVSNGYAATIDHSASIENRPDIDPPFMFVDSNAIARKLTWRDRIVRAVKSVGNWFKGLLGKRNADLERRAALDELFPQRNPPRDRGLATAEASLSGSDLTPQSQDDPQARVLGELQTRLRNLEAQHSRTSKLVSGTLG